METEKGIRFFKGTKPTFLFYMIWSSPSIGTSIMLVLLGYVTYFATNVLGLSTGLVGMMMLASKIFDGFTDIIAGFLIDRTHTRFGRARPYDFAGLMFCFFAIILFGIPQMGASASAVYIFVIYTIIFSAWQTLTSCASAVYMARAIPDENARISAGSIGGMIAMVFATVIGVFLPQWVANAGNDRGEWFKLALALGIPCMILSMVRFFLVKEVADSSVKASMNIREGASQLFHNKYIILYALALLIANISSNMSQASPYYFQYIVGDISKQTFAALGNVVGPFTLIFFPIIAKKIGLRGVIQLGLVCGIVGRLLPLLNLTSIPLIIIGAILNSVAFMPIFILANNVVINCMDYGEWKYGKRGEGIYACVIGFCSKVGIGLGSALIGAVMAVSGFDGTLEVQSTASNHAIIMLYTVIPTVAFVIAMIFMHFYKLDKELPAIQEELKARRESL